MNDQISDHAIAIQSALHDLGEERRTSIRRKYLCPQLVADYDGQKMPAQRDFFLVTCQNISAGGISFLSAVKPAGRQMIVALGDAPFLFCIVDVVFCKRRNDLPEQPYQVGCRIVHRKSR